MEALHFLVVITIHVILCLSNCFAKVLLLLATALLGAYEQHIFLSKFSIE